jgi:MFS family permease
VGFFILGFLFGNWATLIPHVKTYYAISDGALGLILLCLPLGAMSFNPFAATLIERFGAQKMMVIGMFIISIAYMIPLSVSSIYLLTLGLIGVGVCMTILNISVNILAALLEKFESINIMSTCHGMFSVGLMTGSLMRSFTLLTGMSASLHMLLMCTFTIVLGLLVRKTILLIPHHAIKVSNEENTKTKMIVPKGILLTIIVISLCINVTEGTMSDWASLYMKEVVHTSDYFVGWGLFGYSAMMATGRLFGDGIIPVLGRNYVLMYGALLAILGLLLAMIFPYTLTAIFGFGLVGLGVSCGAPILYASASRYPGMPAASGLAIMNTYAMGGFLLGPVVIGFISDLTDLPTAFGVVVILGVLWFFKSKSVSLP